MTTINKVLASFVAAVVIGVAIIGAYFFPKFVPYVGNAAAGTTFNTSKIAFATWNPSTSSATSTSILNTDADDRIITSATYQCDSLSTVFNNGTALLSGGLVFRGATTSANSGLPTTLGNSNFILNTSVATSTTWDYSASTTPGLTTNSWQRIWASGSYLSFTANATSSGQCLIGVNYLAK